MTTAGPLLTVPGVVHGAIRTHLLPSRSRAETAAFMFVRPSSDDTPSFDYFEWYPVPGDGFESRSDYHLELTDDARAYVIKRAHDDVTGGKVDTDCRNSAVEIVEGNETRRRRTP